MKHGRWPRYPEYRDSGVEWLGEVPGHWDLVRWRYCCEITQGQVDPTTDENFDRILIAPNHIESGTGRILQLETAYDQGAMSGKYEVRSGELIYSKIRPALRKACISKGEWLCSADMYPVRFNPSILSSAFLLSYVLSEPFSRFMIDESMRVAMPKVNRETLAGIPIPIPPLSEQHAIANFLDHQTARIDTLIAKNERLLELLDEKRTALITRAVTKGLDPDVPMKESGVEWLGKVPEHWDIKPNGRLFSERDERNRTDLPILSVSIGAGVAVRQFSNDRVEQRAEDLRTYKVAHMSDLAFNKMRMWQGAVGVAPCDGLISPDYTIATPDDRVNPRFYELLFRTSRFMTHVNQNSHGIVPDRNRLYWDRFKQIKSPAPPREEQSAILAHVDNVSDHLLELEQRVNTALALLEEYRTGLISAAVTGHIDVRPVYTQRERGLKNEREG